MHIGKVQELQNTLKSISLRPMPWREVDQNGFIDPYKVLVSEVMLQQTQVLRVIPKFEIFMQAFPSVNDLAKASLSEVLTVWSGLGYNRRAKYLHQAAQKVVNDHDGALPETLNELVTLPGVGKNTAAAIIVYSFNRPAVFIETNIRTVFIHHFFANQQEVSDAAIAELIEQTIDRKNPREWYWSLMDYGTLLKKKAGDAHRRSRSYTKQSTFHGSRRQVRGRIIKALTEHSLSHADLKKLVSDDRLDVVLEDLLIEGLIAQRSNHYSLG